MTSNVDTKPIVEALQQWNWKLDGSGVYMTNGQSQFDTRLAFICRDAILEARMFGEVKYAFVVKCPPKVVVPVHTDTLVIKELRRFHLPLQTNLLAWHWDEAGGMRHLESGKWHEVDYTVNHSLGNYGSEDRIHLIVDVKAEV